jgi:hypothetical protein
LYSRALAGTSYALGLLLLLWMLPQEPLLAARLGDSSSSLRRSPKLDYRTLRFCALQRAFTMEGFQYRTGSGAVLSAPAAAFTQLRQEQGAWIVGELQLLDPVLDLSALQASKPGKGGGGGGPKVEALVLHHWTLLFQRGSITAKASGPRAEFQRPAGAPWSLKLEDARLDFGLGKKLESRLPTGLLGISPLLSVEASGQDQDLNLASLRARGPFGAFECFGKATLGDQPQGQLACASKTPVGLGNLKLAKVSLEGLGLRGLGLALGPEGPELRLEGLDLARLSAFGRELLTEARLDATLVRAGEGLKVKDLSLEARGLALSMANLSVSKGAFGLPSWEGALQLDRLDPVALRLPGLETIETISGQTSFSGGLPLPLNLKLRACRFLVHHSGGDTSLACPPRGATVPVDRVPSLVSVGGAQSLRWGDLVLPLNPGEALQ